jgi:hypothetical protein
MRLVVLDDTHKHSAVKVAEALGSRDVTEEQCRQVAAKMGGVFRIDGDNLIFDFTHVDATIITG